jgi:Domain of Unknown Function (DUF1259)
MGDIVLLEDEVGVAVSTAIEAGLYVTALHNHFIRLAAVRAFHLHVEATSDDAILGRAVRQIVDSIKAVRLAHPVAPAVKEVPSRLDTAQLEEIVEAKGELKDGVFKFTLGRPDVPVKCSRCGGLEINTTMGYNTWASFQGTQERAAVCGDFAMLELEVVPVIPNFALGTLRLSRSTITCFSRNPGSSSSTTGAWAMPLTLPMFLSVPWKPRSRCKVVKRAVRPDELITRQKTKRGR